MATNRQINGDGDIIENAQEASYLKGICVPEWPSASALLIEDGSFLLLEDGSKLLLG